MSPHVAFPLRDWVRTTASDDRTTKSISYLRKLPMMRMNNLGSIERARAHYQHVNVTKTIQEQAPIGSISLKMASASLRGIRSLMSVMNQPHEK